jgi:hypothetical protein
LALSLSLLLASAELLALQSEGDEATLEAVREIQRRSEKLVDELRVPGPPPSENPPSRADS